MARGGFSRRRGPAPVKLYAILGGIALLLVVGVLFWFFGPGRIAPSRAAGNARPGAECRRPARDRRRRQCTFAVSSARRAGARARRSARGPRAGLGAAAGPGRRLGRRLDRVERRRTARNVLGQHKRQHARAPDGRAPAEGPLAFRTRRAAPHPALAQQGPRRRRHAHTRTPPPHRSHRRNRPRRRPAPTLCRRRMGQVRRTPRRRTRPPLRQQGRRLRHCRTPNPPPIQTGCRSAPLAPPSRKTPAPISSPNRSPAAMRSLGVWLMGALPAINSPDITKPEGRFATPLEAAISVAAKLSCPANAFAATSAGRRRRHRAQQGCNARTAPRRPPPRTRRRQAEARRRRRHPRAEGCRLRRQTDDARRSSPSPTISRSPSRRPRTRKPRPKQRPPPTLAALRSAETLGGWPPHRNRTRRRDSRPCRATTRHCPSPSPSPAQRSSPATRSSRPTGASISAQPPKDKQDAWAAARLDLMLALAGATNEKPSAILDRMLEAAPYPVAAANAVSTARTPASSSNNSSRSAASRTPAPCSWLSEPATTSPPHNAQPYPSSAPQAAASPTQLSPASPPPRARTPTPKPRSPPSASSARTSPPSPSPASPTSSPSSAKSA